jgi:uncharacterized protein DUF4198
LRPIDRHVQEMSAFDRYIPGFVEGALIVLLAVSACLWVESPARAFDLFATHEVTTQFATSDGKPMANAEVRVFAPGEPQTPVETGRTDSNGKFVFPADRDGLWSAEARTKTEVARVMIRVGGPAQQQQQSRIPPIVVIGALIGLLAMAVWYRMLRQRNQRRQR